MSSSTPAQYALILLDLAIEAGVDPDSLLVNTGLDEQLTNIGARITDEHFRALVENAMQLTRNPSLGLHLGQRLNLSAHAVLGQAFMTCRDVGEVIELFARYYPMLAQDLKLEFTYEADDVVVESTNLEPGLPLHFGLECMTAGMCNTLRGLLDGDHFPLRFEFPYAAPEHKAEYFRILGADVHFDCAAARWSFPRDMLSRKLPSSNPALRRLYEAECARLLADLEDSADIASQTLRLLRQLEGQYPKMPQIASMLNMSPRTYRRRLEDEGERFQSLLDRARAEHATRHLRDEQLPINSIAYQLGFSDPANFRRAYRRWTGKTPGAVRREAKLQTSRQSI